MYMLNFLFDFGNPNGLFVDNAPAGNPLVNSKHWLRRPAPSAPPVSTPKPCLRPLGWTLAPLELFGSLARLLDLVIRLSTT
jgi:hypothetical protein